MSDEHRPKPSAAAQSGAALKPGAVIAGRYRLERLLGEGGMAKVYEATDLAVGTAVALKVLRADLSASKEAVARLRREGEVLTQLSHPAIVDVHTFGATDEGHLFLVMERLHGTTLRARMGDGPLPIGYLIPIVEAVSAALTTAHRAGVVHRDLKPENIFLGQDGEETADLGAVKLLDFGVSKVVDKERLTQTGQVLGTPRYMAPEQLMAERNIDGRTDQYALGVILYEALSGTPPFLGGHPAELIVSILSGDAVPLSARRPDLPAALCACVDRAMASEPRARFEDMGAFVTAFRTATNYRGPVARATPRAVQKTTPMGAMTLPSEGGSGPRAALTTDAGVPGEQAEPSGTDVPRAPLPVTRVSEQPEALISSLDARERKAASVTPVARPWAKTSPSRAVAKESAVVSTATAGSAGSFRQDTPMGESWLPVKRRPWLMVSLGLFAGALSAALAIGLLRSCGNEGAGATTPGEHEQPSRPDGSDTQDAPLADDGAGLSGVAARIGGGQEASSPKGGAETPNDAMAQGSAQTAEGRASVALEPVEPERSRRQSRRRSSRATRRATADLGARSSEGSSAGRADVTESAAPTPFEQSMEALKAARQARSSGDLAACVTYAEKTLALSGPPIALRLRGDCQRLLGETEAARVSYERFCRVVGASHPAIGEVRALVQALGGRCP